MHAVIAEQVGVVLNAAKVVDGHRHHIGAAAFDNAAQDKTADPAKAINCDFNCHGVVLRSFFYDLLLGRIGLVG